ncbi:hypothetical protein DCO58_10980 [Helicobacter saguini]|uniref:Major outer membrane protein n=1 Tax=Helicobacter saguini TaxID=1548018 RepID=A0A347VYJ2_9HELI|nr:hypothetical protein [Helicobacter saguini]MWV61182.1 hypothetical protein [Helicobacter saguini]MWV68151.1 hypothetical protein [Helicobacter saguini]MWV70386.1 hypothetical protein [Helicobacter saguini]MWV72287.1 hypothetical protein [Helicobacter saguini]TLD95326.1 hypothetical protein LS64_002995 [Helicobacter saguini]
MITKLQKHLLILVMAFAVFSVNSNAVRLMDVIENATLDGFAFGRFVNVHGRDADGSRWQLRLKPTITTGQIAGFSASAGIFFSKGSTTPDGNNTDGDISGSRGDIVSAFVDRFNIADFYVTYNALDSLNTKTILQGGQKSVVTPFNDTILDRALGIFVQNTDLDFLNISFQWWDTWISDDIFISRANTTPAAAGLGNNVFVLGFNSSKDFTKSTRFSYNFWYALSHRFLDFMIFADVGYSFNIGKHAFNAMVQSTAARIANQPTLFSNSSDFNTLFSSNTYNYAKNRGTYNIRLDYKYNLTNDSESNSPNGYIGASLGLAGSFLNGYGTMFDNTGGLKLGGILWNNFAGTEANGFGLFGSGGFNNSSIFLVYGKAEFNYKKFGVSLDAVFVTTSHFFVLKKGSSGHFANLANLNNVTANLHGSANKFVPVSFLELSPAITYKFTSNISAVLQYGYLMGDLNMGRIRAQVNYVF